MYWKEWDLNFEFDLSPDQGGLLPINLIVDEQEGEICGPSEGPVPDIHQGSIREWELVHNRIYGTNMEELCPRSLFICSLDDALQFQFGIKPVAPLSCCSLTSSSVPSVADTYMSVEKQKVSELC